MKHQHHFINLWRIIKAGLNNFVRNAWLSTAATAIMIVTLTIILFGFASNIALDATIDEVVQKIDVSVYLYDDYDESTRVALENEIRKLDVVKNVTHIDKLAALDNYREQNAGNEALLEAVNAENNPLPESLEVNLYDLNETEQVISVVEREEFAGIVESTTYEADRQAIIQRIGSASTMIVRGSVIASLVFAVISVLIIFNTIRMAIFNRSEEVGIMRLVGATGRFIKGPFVFESIIYGLIAGVISYSLIHAALTAVGPKISTHIRFDVAIQVFDTYWWAILGSSMLLGVIIGSVSSLLAINRYMRI